MDVVIKVTDDERVDIIATDVDEDTAEPIVPAQSVVPVLVPLPDDQGPEEGCLNRCLAS